VLAICIENTNTVFKDYSKHPTWFLMAHNYYSMTREKVEMVVTNACISKKASIITT